MSNTLVITVTQFKSVMANDSTLSLYPNCYGYTASDSYDQDFNNSFKSIDDFYAQFPTKESLVDHVLSTPKFNDFVQTLNVSNETDIHKCIVVYGYDELKFNELQLDVVLRSRFGETDYGNIDDLDPSKYDDMQMCYVSLGRGCDGDYGNIDDLDPSKYNEGQMLRVSYGRGDNASYGNIDDLDPDKFSSEDMLVVSCKCKK